MFKLLAYFGVWFPWILSYLCIFWFFIPWIISQLSNNYYGYDKRSKIAIYWKLLLKTHIWFVSIVLGMLATWGIIYWAIKYYSWASNFLDAVSR